MNQKVLIKMGFKPTSHNEIYLDHLETITDFLIEQCPVHEKKALSMLRGSTGISLRYVKEITDSLIAWGIIKKNQGMYEWVLEGCQEKKTTIEGLKNEDVPDTFSGDMVQYQEWSKEIKPCKFRTEIGQICNPLPGKMITISADNCNRCDQREEA